MTVTDNSASWVDGSPGSFSASLSAGTTADFTKPVQFNVQQGSFTNVGTYTIVPFGAISSTFRLSYVNGTLTVTPATLTITANPASKVYGTPNPTFTSQTSGFVNGDTASSIVSGLTLTTPATFGSGAGSYAIVPSATLAGSNYSPQFVNGTFTITPAPLMITADPFSKVWLRQPELHEPGAGTRKPTAAGCPGRRFTSRAALWRRSYTIVLSGNCFRNPRRSSSSELTVMPATLTAAPNASRCRAFRRCRPGAPGFG